MINLYGELYEEFLLLERILSSDGNQKIFNKFKSIISGLGRFFRKRQIELIVDDYFYNVEEERARSGKINKRNSWNKNSIPVDVYFKMNHFLVAAMLVCLIACSIKSKDGNKNILEAPQRIEPLIVTPEGDIDGDSITNQKELELGRNPFVAELPDLQVRFLQNYKINFTAKGITGTASEGVVKDLEINTRIGQDNPDFEYRVGNLFARNNTYKVIAGIGRFSGHSWGDIDDHDFSWVKYPDIDPIFYHQKMIESRPYVRSEDFELSNINIELENTVKLRANNHFTEIKNLEVSFYYYNYVTQNFELIKTHIEDRHFKAGVTETFSVQIENAPEDLLTDNYLSKGEFIISEVTNFEIPELGMDYKTYLGKIKTKSIPVVINTPQETTLYYVGVDGKADSFIGIMEHLFPSKMVIQENRLIKLNEFENNLENYTYLKEVKDKDKNGKWFILTNKFTQHYLDHPYTTSDKIIVSYLTGKDLATQKDELVYAYQAEASGADDFKLYPLGNISPNSEVNIQIMPMQRFGQSWEHKSEIIDIPQHSCGHNCVNPGIYCNWDVNVVKDYDEAFKFKPTLEDDVSLIELVVNETSYLLKDLLKDNKVILRFLENGNLNIQIKDIAKITELNNLDTNLLQLKVSTRVHYDFFGPKLLAVDRAWQGMGGCGFNTPAVGYKYNTRYISKESIHFNDIQITYDQILNDWGRQWHILKEAGFIYQRIKVRVSSTISNYFN